MILHIVDDEKFLLTAITIFESILPKRNNFLVGIHNDVSYNNSETLGNLTQIHFEKVGSNNYKHLLLTNLENASLVIFHNMYKDYKLDLINSNVWQSKTAWIFWGAELYGINPKINTLLPITHKEYFKSLPFKTFVRKKVFAKIKKVYYWNIFKNALEGKIDYTLTNISEDIDLLDTLVKNNSKRGWFSYYSFDEKVIHNISSAQKRNILIGNSSSETNNHFDAFQLLKGVDLTDRKIYIPLNYGDGVYREKVIKNAIASFGKQAIPINDFLKLNEYTEMINSCSVLILNNKRQQAFNTIMIALANGCKVYLREENTIFPYLKRQGFIIYSISKELNSKDGLEELQIRDQNHNLKLIKELYSYDVVMDKIKIQIENILNE